MAHCLATSTSRAFSPLEWHWWLRWLVPSWSNIVRLLRLKAPQALPAELRTHSEEKPWPSCAANGSWWIMSSSFSTEKPKATGCHDANWSQCNKKSAVLGLMVQMSHSSMLFNFLLRILGYATAMFSWLYLGNTFSQVLLRCSASKDDWHFTATLIKFTLSVEKLNEIPPKRPNDPFAQFFGAHPKHDLLKAWWWLATSPESVFVPSKTPEVTSSGQLFSQGDPENIKVLYLWHDLNSQSTQKPFLSIYIFFPGSRNVPGKFS